MSNLLQRALIESGAENDLSNLAQALADKYEENLQLAEANATYDLSKAAMNYYLHWKGETLLLTFRLPEEWYYVEHGRQRTTGKTGKRWDDPVGDIMRWIELKRIVPQTQMKSARVPKNSKALSEMDKRRNMAQAIVRKIHKRGFYTTGMIAEPQGKHLLEKSVVEVEVRERLVGILKDAMGNDIKVELNDMVKTFHK